MLTATHFVIVAEDHEEVDPSGLVVMPSLRGGLVRSADFSVNTTLANQPARGPGWRRKASRRSVSWSVVHHHGRALEIQPAITYALNRLAPVLWVA